MRFRDCKVKRSGLQTVNLSLVTVVNYALGSLVYRLMPVQLISAICVLLFAMKTIASHPFLPYNTMSHPFLGVQDHLTKRS